MAFSKKTWRDRDVEHPTRRKLNIIENSENVIVANVERYDGTVTENGDPFNAQTMNDMENRINAETNAIERMIGSVNTTGTAPDDTYTKGKYIVYNGKFYQIIQDISQGSSLVVGSNIRETKLSFVVYALNTSFSTLKSSLTSQINNLSNTFTTSLRNLITTVGHYGEAIQDIKNVTVAQTHFTLTNVQITNGGANFGPFNVGTVIRVGNVVGLTVTAVGGSQADVYGGTIIDNRPSNCTIHVANLSNPSFTGRVNLEIIVSGRAY